MSDISATEIIEGNSTTYLTINGSYVFPTAGYFIYMQQTIASSVTVAGSPMTMLTSLDTGAREFESALYGLYVPDGTYNITSSSTTYCVHGLSFANANSYIQVTTKTTNKSPTITPTKGNAVAQFVYVTESYGSTYSSGYVPPSGFTKMTDSAAQGSGGDWWHGGGSSYKINTGTSLLTLTYVFQHSDGWHGYCVELEPSGGGGVIWWTSY